MDVNSHHHLIWCTEFRCQALTKLLSFLYSRDITVQIMKLFRSFGLPLGPLGPATRGSSMVSIVSMPPGITSPMVGPGLLVNSWPTVHRTDLGVFAVFVRRKDQLDPVSGCPNNRGCLKKYLIINYQWGFNGMCGREFTNQELWLVDVSENAGWTPNLSMFSDFSLIIYCKS